MPEGGPDIEKGPEKSKVCLVTLGCAKNLVDSENMLGLLSAEGYIIAPGLEQADIGIVNTCGFIESAVEESVAMILEIAEQKRTGRLKRLYVTGCMVQRFGYKLKKELPEVDGWLGTGELDAILRLLNGKTGGDIPFLISRPTFLADHEMPRIQSSPFYSAYVKIAEGCSHRCAYCTIPSLRGPFRSRPPGSILAEVEAMAGRGVKEINLVAQDTMSYGTDLPERCSLEDLLERLVRVNGIEWIRILYGHPQGTTHRLLELMEEDVGPGAEVVAGVVHAMVPEEAEALRETVEARFKCREMHTFVLGPIAGTHFGPGTIGVGYYTLG